MKEFDFSRFMKEFDGFVDRKPANEIKNCATEFRFKCPKDWDALDATESATIRFCQSCSQKVFLCHTDAEALDYARRGDCVALPRHTGEGVPVLWVGRPSSDKKPSPDQRAAQIAYYTDNRKTKALQALKYSSRFCPECGFPCPNWYDSCGVCGYPVGRIKLRPGNDSGSAAKSQE